MLAGEFLKHVNFNSSFVCLILRLPSNAKPESTIICMIVSSFFSRLLLLLNVKGRREKGGTSYMKIGDVLDMIKPQISITTIHKLEHNTMAIPPVLGSI